MKIDYDEVLSILTTFQDAETPFLTLQDLGMAEAEGEEKDKKFFILCFSLIMAQLLMVICSQKHPNILVSFSILWALVSETRPLCLPSRA